MAKAGVVIRRALSCRWFSILFPALPNHRAGAVVFAFSARCWLAIQHCDYPFDNHKVPFNVNDARRVAHAEGGEYAIWRAHCALYDSGAKLFIMPVAVCGATAMWVGLLAWVNALWK